MADDEKRKARDSGSDIGKSVADAMEKFIAEQARISRQLDDLVKKVEEINKKFKT